MTINHSTCLCIVNRRSSQMVTLSCLNFANKIAHWFEEPNNIHWNIAYRMIKHTIIWLMTFQFPLQLFRNAVLWLWYQSIRWYKSFNKRKRKFISLDDVFCFGWMCLVIYPLKIIFGIFFVSFFWGGKDVNNASYINIFFKSLIGLKRGMIALISS